MSSTIRPLLGADSGRSQLSDDEIVQRVRAGETGLFEILMRRYNQRLYRIVRTLLSDDDETEDVMQQAYVNAYLHLDQFASQAAFATWLTRIAVHEALARVRRRCRFAEAASGGRENAIGAVPAPAPDPEQQAFVSELRALIESAVDALPGHYRSVFVMRDVEGMTTAETAACLAVSEDAVKTRLHRARVLLRNDLYQRAGVTAARAIFPFMAARCDRLVRLILDRIECSPSGVRTGGPDGPHDTVSR
jgi:RNA polymerase sigma-70 factor (ECF subfamily)